MALDSDEFHVRSLEEARQHIGALRSRVTELERQYRLHEDDLDTFVRTRFWKKVLFLLDGWPLHRIVDRPRWRPWHRWWVS